MVTCVQPTWAGVGVLDECVGQWRYGFRRARQVYRQPRLLINMPTTSVATRDNAHAHGVPFHRTCCPTG
eukprot:2960435-Lingulodinium_polyedra.AAC.1